MSTFRNINWNVGVCNHMIHVFTHSIFLLSIQGPMGPAGPRGETGSQGLAGDKGHDGMPGAPGKAGKKVSRFKSISHHA